MFCASLYILELWGSLKNLVLGNCVLLFTKKIIGKLRGNKTRWGYRYFWPEEVLVTANLWPLLDQCLEDLRILLSLMTKQSFSGLLNLQKEYLCNIVTEYLCKKFADHVFRKNMFERNLLTKSSERISL